MPLSMKQRTLIGHLILHLLLIALMGVFMFPLYWLFVSTFKPMNTIFRIPFEWVPEHWTMDNIAKGWHFLGNVSFTTLYMNTIYVTVVAVIATIISATLVAFGFARLRFAGRNFWFLVLLATMMLPSQVTLVPNYLIFKYLHLLDTLPALYIGALFGGGAFYIFMIRQFIMGLPIEMDESARMDGASTFIIFWKIVFPLCKPVIITVLIFSFADNYTDFFTPLIYINTITKFTVPLGINAFLDESGSGNMGAAIAMTTLSVAPLILVYFLAQKQFMQGIATTGLKG